MRPDEQELWSRIAKSANPMRSAKPDKGEPGKITLPGKAKPVPEKPRPEPIAPFRLGERASTALPPNDLSAPLGDRLAAQPVAMDKKAHKRMSQGRLTPEGRIDLHGMTLDTAHGALTSFILSSQAAGKRLVLVITGKGRKVESYDPIPTRTGVLRHQLPHWLSLPPLSQAVLQVSEAHRKHGGSGAFYVYLRRR
ncbi:Smr/MutS family protein [Kangsaoukella pontilimi]|uniref:Smr/MutS family protein n=1 Tax=Kangsaoukella pontilimi TaxID=2691042 RepID=UPI0029CA6C06|nr:Smr/MutS family protein [Kangsaoukella pontilimi]